MFYMMQIFSQLLNNWQAVSFAQRCKGRRVILLGLPGAFTPT